MGTVTLDVPGTNSTSDSVTISTDVSTTRTNVPNKATQTKAASSGSGQNGQNDDKQQDQTEEDDYLPYQRKIIAHAIFSTAGFLVLLPIGALAGRLGRTFTPMWFTGHWVSNFVFSAPAILVGVSLGMQSN
jgi:hypothetical protein